MDPGGLIQVITVGATAAAGVIVVLGLTVRFVFNPVIKARRLAATAAATSAAETARLGARMDALEEEVRHVGEALDRVATTAEFDRQLRAGAAPPTRLPPS